MIRRYKVILTMLIISIFQYVLIFYHVTLSHLLIKVCQIKQKINSVTSKNSDINNVYTAIYAKNTKPAQKSGISPLFCTTPSILVHDGSPNINLI